MSTNAIALVMPPAVVATRTIQGILKEQGIEPAPSRKKQMSWSEFLRAHWGAIAANQSIDTPGFVETGDLHFDVGQGLAANAYF